MVTDQVLSEVAAGLGERLSRAARRFPSFRCTMERDKEGNLCATDVDSPVSPSCVLRWILDGIRIPGGGKVYLEAVRMSGRYITTPPAIKRFIRAQSPELAAVEASPRPAGKREKVAAAASARLEKEGW